jgi:hypothetical protein
MKWQAPSEEELARRGIKPATDDPASDEAPEAPKPKRSRKAKE